MWVMLFGWKQRPFWRDKGRSGAGCGVRYSQPRAEPADGRAPCGNPPKDDRGASWGGQTIGTNSSSASPHLKPAFLERWKRGAAPARQSPCCLLGGEGGSAGWPPATPSLLRPPGESAPRGAEGSPRDRLRVVGGRVQGPEQGQQGRGRGTSVWAGVRGVGPGPGSRAAPPGSGSSAGWSRKTPVAVGR